MSTLFLFSSFAFAFLLRIKFHSHNDIASLSLIPPSLSISLSLSLSLIPPSLSISLSIYLSFSVFHAIPVSLTHSVVLFFQLNNGGIESQSTICLDIWYQIATLSCHDIIMTLTVTVKLLVFDSIILKYIVS